MAIPTTPEGVAALTSLSRYDRLHVDVSVDEGNSWFDMTNIEGEDFVRSATIDQQEETRVRVATIVFARESSTRALAPQSAAVQFIRPGRRVRMAITVTDDAGNTTGRVERFEGRIDDIEWGGDASTLTVRARDLLGDLNDVWIERAGTYGGTTPNMIRSILRQWAPDVPFAAVGSWPLVRIGVELPITTVVKAINELNAGDSGAVTMRHTGGAWRLTLVRAFDPAIDGGTPVLTFTPSNYYAVPKIGTSNQGIKDRIILEGETPNGDSIVVTRQTLTPQTGPRYRTTYVNRGDDPSVRTIAAALAAADSALRALSRSPLAKGITHPIDTRLELGDFIAYAPNGTHATATINSVVTGIRDVYERNANRMEVTVRGSFVGSVGTWVSRIVSTQRRQQDRSIPGGDWFYTNRFQNEALELEGSWETSLGRWMSLSRIPNALSALFEAQEPNTLPAPTSVARDRFIIIALANTTDEIRRNVRVFVEREPDVDPGGIIYRVALDPRGVRPIIQENQLTHGRAINNHTVRPLQYAFATAIGIDNGIVVGDMGPNTVQLVGVQLTVEPGATPRTTRDEIVAAECLPEDV